jgi:hypothetical protein
MASDIDRRPQAKLPPQQPESGATKVSNDGATPLETPTTNGKPITTTTSGEARGATPPTLQTTNLVPLFPDTTGDASASDAGADADSDSTTSRVVSPVTSPPYWQLSNTNSNGNALRPRNSHNRTASAESVLPAGAITLLDNEDVSSEARNGDVYGRDRNRACWAKSVEVDSHVVVNGSATNIGAFVVWNIRVETLSVSRFRDWNGP